MRLLKLDDLHNLSVTADLGNDVPPYAILSHTWLPDSDAEVDYGDVVSGASGGKPGIEKVYFCGHQAAVDHLDHFWVDTCCINRSSEPELSQAIRSMFRWYRDAAKCYVYLSDVQVSTEAPSSTWMKDFMNSRWFERGWTLQELLAPTSVEFFSREGTKLGDKASLMLQIHERTRIPLRALRGSQLPSFSIEERLSWAHGRQTKRDEDSVYSLLGLFDIHIPILYGEGQQNALKRLRRELRADLDSNLQEALPDLSFNTLDRGPQRSLRLQAQSQSPLPAQFSTAGFGTPPGLIADTGSTHDMQRPLRTWLGDVCTEVYTEDYNRWRHELSNAAKFGGWDKMWHAMNTGLKKFEESWVDAIRIKSRTQGDQLSFWTPLHQAVYMEAPIEVVRQLLHLGAFRTLRTRWTEFSEHDMTPLELARDMKREYLYDVLAPVIRSPLPSITLSRLETQFHALIRTDLGRRVDEDGMYLPLLEVLTELSTESVWFPVNLGPFKAGYIFQLQERTLLVRSFNIPSPVTQKTYRITRNSTKKIEEYVRHDESE